MTYMRFFYALLAAMGLLAAYAQPSQAKLDVPKLVAELKSAEDDCSLRAAFLALHAAGKEAIPHLIEGIDDNTPTRKFVINPISSSLPMELQDGTFKGVLSAYAIELILGRSKLASRRSSKCDYVLELEDYVHQLGVIRAKDDRPITAEDLPRIKTKYKKWWAAKAKVPIGKLREEWGKNRRPLTGSDYSWR